MSANTTDSYSCSLGDSWQRTFSSYFFGGLTGPGSLTHAPVMGCDEQNGWPVSMGTIQRQPVWQGLVALQPPPQVAEPFASLRNCRAETVPAQRTPMTSAVKNIDLIFFMIAFLLVP